MNVDPDVLEYLRRLVLGDELMIERFRNLVSADYNRLIEKCLNLSRENHVQNLELQDLRQLNQALLTENEKLREQAVLLAEGVKQASQENSRLLVESLHLTRSPSARLLRRPQPSSAGSGSAAAASAASGASGSSVRHSHSNSNLKSPSGRTPHRSASMAELGRR